MELILLFFLSGLVRILLLCPNSSDNWLVWYSVRNQTKPWLNHAAYNSCIEGTMGSPKLQYYIVSLFPHKYQVLAGNFLNIAYDLIVLASLYGLSFAMSEGGNPRATAFIVAVVYATAPILLLPSARLSGVKARTLGGLLAFFYLLALEQALLFNHPEFYLACGVLSVLAVLGSAFAMQVIVFFSVCLSFFYLSPAPALAAVVPVCIAYFIPGLGLKEIARHKLNHYMWYFDNYAGTLANNRNDFAGLWKELRTHRRYNVLLYHLFMTQSILIALYSLPATLILAWFLATDGQFVQLVGANPTYTYYALILLCSLILFVATTTRFLRFLGEAERYFEYSVPFSCLLLVPLLDSGRLDFMASLCLILYQVTVVFSVIFFKYRFEYKKAFETSEPDKEDLELIELIGGLPDKEPKVLVMPTKHAFRLAALTARDAGVRYLLYFVTTRIDGFRYMRQGFKHYEALEYDFDFLRSEYGINTVVTVNDMCRVLPGPTNAVLSKATMVGQNSKYTLYTL